MVDVRVPCLICTDATIDSTELTLIANQASIDYSFVHCGTETRRYADRQMVQAALALGVRIVHAEPPVRIHCSCGSRMFNLGGVSACRNCDTPMPGLPPSDRQVAR
jgi:hypothetical protein